MWLDAIDPDDAAIHPVLDNHSAHVSSATTAWLAVQPDGRLELTPA
jgi:hypothetical protein